MKSHTISAKTHFYSGIDCLESRLPSWFQLFLPKCISEARLRCWQRQLVPCDLFLKTKRHVRRHHSSSMPSLHVLNIGLGDSRHLSPLWPVELSDFQTSPSGWSEHGQYFPPSSSFLWSRGGSGSLFRCLQFFIMLWLLEGPPWLGPKGRFFENSAI